MCIILPSSVRFRTYTFHSRLLSGFLGSHRHGLCLTHLVPPREHDSGTGHNFIANLCPVVLHPLKGQIKTRTKSFRGSQVQPGRLEVSLCFEEKRGGLGILQGR